MIIYLIGFMGSGKSTVGKKLARKLDYSFIDLDRSIEQSQQLLIDTIFKQFGEEQFRLWESEELQRYLDKSNVVISTGGGTPCFHANMEYMNQTGITIYLRMKAESLYSRLSKAKYPRPLLQNKSKNEVLEFIQHLLAQRENYYAQAKLIIDGMNPNIETIAMQIKKHIKS